MKKVLLSVGMFLLPVVALAQQGPLGDTETNLTDTVDSLTAIVNKVIPFLLAIAVVVFIWGVIKYIISQSSEDKMAARNVIVYGIIGIVVILSIFGLVKLTQDIFGIGNVQLQDGDIPQIP